MSKGDQVLQKATSNLLKLEFNASNGNLKPSPNSEFDKEEEEEELKPNYISNSPSSSTSSTPLVNRSQRLSNFDAASTSSRNSSLSKLWKVASKSSNSHENYSDWVDYVLQFSSSNEHNGIRSYILQRISETGLKVIVSNSDDGIFTFFLVSCSIDLLYEGAEFLKLEKFLKNQISNSVPFQIKHKGLFKDIENGRDFFTPFEREKIVYHLLASIEAKKGDTFSFQGSTFYENELLIPRLVHDGLIQAIFPLHDSEKIQHFVQVWISSPFNDQPLDEVRDYFGEKISFYFSWLGYYTTGLIFPAIFGVIVYLTQWWNESPDNILALSYSIFVSLWGTVFLEFWKRQSNVHAFKWKVLDKEIPEEIRPGFYGKLKINEITRKLEYSFSFQERFRYYMFSWVATFLCLSGCYYFMLLFLQMYDWILTNYPNSILICYFPLLMYAIFVPFINSFYGHYAKLMTRWENHKTERDYEIHLASKRVTFDLCNHFCSLFYIAFVRSDFTLLRYQLGILLITQSIVSNFQEVILPQYFSEKKLKQTQHPDSPPQVYVQSFLETYDSTFDDYLEMATQFGYVTFFAVAFPLAALCALFNNMIEVRSDAFKLCFTCKKPSGNQSANGIGMWQDIFTILSIISVITNGALIVFTSKQMDLLFPNLELAYKLLIVVVGQYFLLLAKFILDRAIPDFPDWIVAIQKRKKYLEEVEKKEKKSLISTSANSDDSNNSKETEDLELKLEREFLKLQASKPHYEPTSHKSFPEIYGTLVLTLFSAFLLGYFQFHWLWLPWLYLFFAHIEERHRKWLLKEYESRFSLKMNSNSSITNNYRDNSVKWINELFQVVWPTYSQVISENLVNSVQPMLDIYRPSFINSIKFNKCDMGRRPLQFESTVMHPIDPEQPNLVLMDLNFSFPSDLDIQLGLKVGFLRGTIALQNFEIQGRLRVRMDILHKPPYIGTLGVSFYENPKIDFKIKPLVGFDVKDLPGLAGFLDSFISKTLTGMMVLPKELVIPLTSENPQKYILHIELKSGHNLAIRDIGGTSDPYVIFQIGKEKLVSKTIPKTLDPIWNEKFQIPVSNYKEESLQLAVYDKDLVNDEKMGDFTIPLRYLSIGTQRNMWIDLENVESGQIELSLLLLPEGFSNPGSLQIQIHQVFGISLITNLPFSIQLQCGLSKVNSKLETNKDIENWNETLLLHPVFLEKDKFMLYIIADDNTIAGQAEVNLLELEEMKLQEFWLEIQGTTPIKSKIKPTIHLELLYSTDAIVSKMKEEYIAQVLLCDAKIESNLKRSFNLTNLKKLKVQFRIGKFSATSENAKVDLLQNPACVWNASYDFPIQDLLTEKLYIKLLGDGDKLLGKGELILADFEEKKLNDRWISLDENETFKIHVQYSIVKMTKN